MRRTVVVMVAVALVVTAGCSQILGLSPPREGSGGPPGDGPPAGGSFDFAILPLTVTVPQGGMNFVDVSITRLAGYDEAVTVSVNAPPPGLMSVDAVIAAGDTTGHVQVSATAALTLGTTLTLTLAAAGGSGAAQITKMASVPATVTGQPGTLDASFGSGGIVGIDNLKGAQAQTASIGSDGAVLGVGGTIALSGPFPFIVHTDADGTLDSAFAGGGAEQIDVGPPGAAHNTDSLPIAIRHQISGNIVLAASSHEEATTPRNNDVTLVRLTPAGALDTTFGLVPATSETPVGFNEFDLGSGTDDSVSALGLDSSDRPVFGGSSNGSAYVARTDENGFGIDPTFGGGSGTVVAPLAGTVTALAFDSSKRIVAAGNTLVGGHGQAFVFRLAQNGTLDPTFHGGAVATFGGATFDETVIGVFVLADGKLLTVGTTNQNGGIDVVLRRIGDDGTPDPTFGGDGHVVTAVTDGDDNIAAVAQLSDGRILLALNVSGGTVAGPVLARLLPDGTPDPTFGPAGVASIFFGNHPTIFGFDVDPLEQKIVIAGIRDGVDFHQFVLARFWD